MADNVKIGDLKTLTIKGLSKIDVEELKSKAKEAADTLTEKAVEAKDAAVAAKDDITEKLTELDRMLSESITEYNDAYTIMNDKGIKLFVERSRSLDTISFVENIVNSIANKPKSFETEFAEININRKAFIDSCEFADRELKEARNAATGAGAGLAAGASVAYLAPSAAMWIATTFGTSSTGVAISTLSGAARNKAALAWLGRGAVSAGGKGIAGGKALIALSGPLGTAIAGATLLSTIIVFSAKKTKLNKQKNEEITALKENIEAVREMDAQINTILVSTEKLRTELNVLLGKTLSLYEADYTDLDDEKKQLLGALINNTKALSAMFTKTIGE